MRQVKLYFDKDKETAWLNEMSGKGWAMTGFFAGLYSFEPCEPGKYVYQVDFSDKFMSVSENYRELMKEMDIEILQNWGYWVILRKEASGEPFELYTDVDSQIEHYSKILKVFKVVTILEMLCLFLVAMSTSFGRDIVAWLSVLFISVVVFAFSSITLRTKERIRRLKEVKTGIEEDRGKMSMVLMTGLLLNLVRMSMGDKLPDPIAILLSICAIILMLAGIMQVSDQRRR